MKLQGTLMLTPAPSNTQTVPHEKPAWQVLRDGLEEIWVQEVGLHGLKLRSPENSSILQHKHKSLSVKNDLSRKCGTGEHLGWCQ